MMKTRMKQTAAFLFAMMALATTLPVNSNNFQAQGRPTLQNQTQLNWRVYSPPDKSFTVELPQEPRRTNKMDPTSNDEASFFECTKSVDAYEIQLKPQSPEYAFVIGVFNVSGCQRKAETFNKEVKGLVAVIGGDDKRLIKDKQVKVNGLPGREFIYENGELYGRVLVVNAGKRIYMVTYTNDASGTTTSAETTRMFSSFRPVRGGAAKSVRPTTTTAKACL
jgi:hypothetical protein